MRKFIDFRKFSSPAKASIALMMTQMVQKGLNIISEPIYTRLLTTEEYGESSLFFSWYEIVIIFTGLCLSKGVFNNGMLEFKEDRDIFSLSMYVLTLSSTILIGIIVIPFCIYANNFLRIPVYLIFYMFLLLAFEAALSMWSVRQRFEYHYKATAAVTISLATLSPLCGIISITLFPEHRVAARIIGARTVALTAYLIVAACLFIKANGKIKIEYWKYALLFNLPLLPHYLSLHILNHTDRIMIASIAGTSDAGIYSVAYNGCAAIKLFWTSINASLIPWTYEQCEKKDFKRLGDLTRVLVFAFALLCVCFMFLAPEVMKILSPVSYHEGVYVIPSVVAGVFFSMLYYIFANVVYYYKKPKYVMIGSVVSATVNIVLNAIFIPAFGYLAAGYTTMVSYILQAMIDYWAMKKVLEHDIYDMRLILVLSFSVIFAGVVLSFIYSYTLFRLLLFAIFLTCTLFYIQRNIYLFRQFIYRRH